MTDRPRTVEANFDGLIGPTHNYAGLSFGNLASAANADLVANPREAAKQGLAKMKHLADLGLVQGVLPPHQRPHLPSLRSLGFAGSDAEIVAKAAAEAPGILRNVSAAAAMWTANAATVSPGTDTADGRVHFTPANLAAMFHRSIEPATTGRVLKAIFADESHFAHHQALSGGVHFGDEGAANHNRFCNDYGEAGLALFVYGREAFGDVSAAPNFPAKFPARQTLEASEAIARQHGLGEGRALYARQSPAVIDAGAFHNDVVAVANQNVFFYHEEAFEEPAKLCALLQAAAPEIDFQFIEVAASDVPIGDAVKSYLFNSQLVSQPGESGAMTLILPEEARETLSTRAYLDGLAAGNHPIRRIEFLDVRQSMCNGGGPACLRLRVVLSEAERAAMAANVLLNDALYGALSGWIDDHYRDRLLPDDLADPALMEESNTALDALTGILGLGAIYDFQR